LETRPPELQVVAGGPAAEPAGPTAPTELAEPASPLTLAPAPPVLRIALGGQPQGPHRSGDPEWHGERFSNATHRSTTDPEARLYRKSDGQETKLRYLGHYLADVRCGVIYGAMATQATGTAEREAALALLDGLDALPSEVAADLGYRDGDFLAAVMARGVQPLVPLQDEPLEAEPRWQRGTANPAWRAKRAAKVAAARARNATRRAAQGRHGAVAQRQRTRLEHLFAEGKEHHGLGRAQGRGLVRVDQQVKMTASVQNLKRWVRARPRRRAAAALAPAAQVVSAGNVPVSPWRGRRKQRYGPCGLPGRRLHDRRPARLRIRIESV